ncbi:MAG TPA: endonuclease/exonuclease/phosphatase family protein [Pseudobdellovibrionaceae bacterium]|nr:endonuclease/exonuclease/phosphatase family protein [Pseudobdellovibrionaceae bacterium]
MKFSLGGAFIVTLLVLSACSRPGQTPSQEGVGTPPPLPPHTLSELKICSFNIQFLGNSSLRDNEALARMLKQADCDAVVVQELVAPPDLRLLKGSPHFGAAEPPRFPDSNKLMNGSEKSTKFFLAMEAEGYADFVLSEEDTGPGAVLHINSSATEWWVTFYRRDRMTPAADLPQGYLSSQRAGNAKFDRVPYATAFRSLDQNFDFVLISTHLRPGARREDALRRKQELEGIAEWIDEASKSSPERDFIILGDMNIESGPELAQATPAGFVSLNTESRFMTNTNVAGPKPYDHVMVNPRFTPEVPVVGNFTVLNLIELMRPFWKLPTAFPGEPYIHNIFRMYYSDHHPVRFVAQLPVRDDD